MRRTTSALAAVLLGTGTAVAVVTALPASANDSCGGTVTAASPQGFYFQNAHFDATGINVSGGQTTHGYVGKELTSEVPLSIVQSSYSAKTDDGVDVYKTGFAYYLGIDQDGDTGTADAIDNLFYEPQSYGVGIWHDGNNVFTGTLAQFKLANPNATVSEFDVNYGPGVPEGVEHLRSITFQGCTYQFVEKVTPPTTTPPATTTPAPPAGTGTGSGTGTGTGAGTTTATKTTAAPTTQATPAPANAQFQAIPNTSAGINTGGL